MSRNKGFIALTIVLTVSGILLGLIFISSVESALFFDQAMKKQYRTMNYYHAYSCIDQAVLILSHDYFFNPSYPLIIPELNCSILSVYENGNMRTIKTVGDFMDANVYRQASVKMSVHGPEVLSIE